MISPIDLITEDLLAYHKEKLCCIWYKENNKENVGTGNIIKFSEGYYILSCEHVLSKVITGEYKILCGNEPIKLNTKKYHYNKKFDVGIMEIEEYDIKAFQENDFNFEFEFEDFNSNDGFFLCGFPAELVEVGYNRRVVQPFCYAASLLTEKDNINDNLFINYPKRDESVETNKLDNKLPYPHGLSGSLLFRLPHWDDVSKELFWSADKAKIVGMQVSSDSRTYLKCTKISRMKSLIVNNGI